ncbi:hypothetical protein HDU76_012247, partial [Blyttiomyces sp. JEL0837]
IFDQYHNEFKQPHPMTDHEWQSLLEVCALLAIFKTCTLSISTSNPSLGLVLPNFNVLLNHLEICGGLVTDTSNNPQKRGFFRERTSLEITAFNTKAKAEGPGNLLIYENEHLRKACIVGHAKLSKYYAKTDHHIAYSIVVFLTPFFKKNYFIHNMEFAASEWNTIETKIRDILEKKYQPRVYPPNPTPTLSSQLSSSSS